MLSMNGSILKELLGILVVVRKVSKLIRKVLNFSKVALNINDEFLILLIPFFLLFKELDDQVNEVVPLPDNILGELLYC